MFKFTRNKKGMTLLEVLAAVVILGIMIAPLTSFFLVSNQRAKNTRVERQALTVAEAKIESIRYGGFADYQLADAEESREWPWVPSNPKFTGTVKSERFNDGIELLNVTITVAWDKGEVSLSTLVSKYR